MKISIRQAATITSPALALLTACPVELAADEYCKKWCSSNDTAGTSSSSSAEDSQLPTSSTSTSSGDPTDGSSTSSVTAPVDSSTGSTEVSTTNDTGTLTEPWSDAAPVLGEFTVTPDPIVTAGFIELAADCTDDWGVAEVRFLVDGALVGAAPTPPFAAEWLVKSPDQIGDHTLAVECEDIAGNIVEAEQVVSVSLLESGTTAWSAVRPALKGNAEATDAAPAPDGSWWVCGYADNLIGGTGAWVTHYSPSGDVLFEHVISRGNKQTGQCAGIAVASDDSHRAVLTGGFGLTGQWPSMWTALVDETTDSPVLAESSNALAGYFGNDVLVNKYGQFEVAGQAYVGKDDWDMALQIYSYKPGQKELSSAGGLTYGTVGAFDIASAIVENLDGTVTLVGTVTNEEPGIRAGAVKLDAQHKVEKSGGWPFRAPMLNPQLSGALAASVDNAGTLRLTGWRRDNANAPSRMISLVVGSDGTLVSGGDIKGAPNAGDNVGQGIASFSDGSYLISASVTANAVDRNIWTKRLTASDLEVWKPSVFAGLLGSVDEPRDASINVFDQALVVGFETVLVQQDGKAVAVRKAWLRAYHG